MYFEMDMVSEEGSSAVTEPAVQLCFDFHGVYTYFMGFHRFLVFKVVVAVHCTAHICCYLNLCTNLRR